MILERHRPVTVALALLGLAWPAACGGPSSEAGARTADAEGGDSMPAHDTPVELAPDTRVILVTGSTGGLGREVARRLAAGGAHVIVHGRDRERGASLVREIEASGVGSARFYPADFAALDNVRALAEAVRRDYDRLDVLVNNAGILVSPDRRPLSEDGHELHFQVNYLAGFLLTRLLLPLLEESAPARIVNVSSLSVAPLDFDDLMLEDGYSTGRAYGQSKLAQVMFTIDLARRLDGTGVTVNAVHPATFMDTDMVREFGMRPRTSVDEGADAVMRLIDADDVGSGAYYDGLSRSRAHAQAYDPGARARLWAASEELTGLGVAGG